MTNTSHNNGKTYSQLRRLNSDEQLALNNRINLRHDLLKSGLHQETSRGRVPNANIRANIALSYTNMVLPFYRSIRESRWIGQCTLDEVAKLKVFRREQMKLAVTKKITPKQYNDIFFGELERVAKLLKMNSGDLGFMVIS